MTKGVRMTDAGNTTSKIEWRLELVQVPVSDIDRAKAFYLEQAGFRDVANVRGGLSALRPLL